MKHMKSKSRTQIDDEHFENSLRSVVNVHPSNDWCIHNTKYHTSFIILLPFTSIV